MNTTLGAVVALVLWSLVILSVMAVRRFSAMRAKGISLAGRRGGRGGDLDPVIGNPAAWASHNYTHLMEQPTLFYAVALALAAIHQDGSVNAALAWAYVALRIVHSLVQITSNLLTIRAPLFFLSTGVLIALAVSAALALAR